MTCESVKASLPLLHYGELSFDEEERIELHLESCGGCREHLAKLGSIGRLFDDHRMEPSAAVLEANRAALRAKLVAEGAARRNRSSFAWSFGGFRHWFDFEWASLNWRPAGALALLALGFFGGRVADRLPLPGNTLSMAGFSQDPVASMVRYVEPGQAGRVQIVVDETRQRIISGRLEDEPIRRLLVAAAKDSADPGLRGESMEILKSRPESAEIRGVLIYALQHDTNDGVRLKALEGLRRFASDPEVSRALAKVLLTDTNPGVRTQAIDLLTQSRESQVVGVLQELMDREGNGYVRQRCQKALREMKASEVAY